eukprot:1159805-Pelagomonas_calceolata.AAC.14
MEWLQNSGIFASARLIVSPFAAHKIQPPSRHVESTVGELSGMHALMYKMRRMEVAAGAFSGLARDISLGCLDKDDRDKQWANLTFFHDRN